MRSPIVVTGLGFVTPIGIGKDEFWSNLLAGKSGIAPVQSFDTSAYNVHLGGEIRGFDPSACGGTHVTRTGAIGIIAIAATERFRGGSRVTFLCGGRALAGYRALRDVDDGRADGGIGIADRDRAARADGQRPHHRQQGVVAGIAAQRDRPAAGRNSKLGSTRI